MHSVVADRLPPFTYKFPGWNGYMQVLQGCIFAIVPGLVGVPLTLAIADKRSAISSPR